MNIDQIFHGEIARLSLSKEYFLIRRKKESHFKFEEKIDSLTRRLVILKIYRSIVLIE